MTSGKQVHHPTVRSPLTKIWCAAALMPVFLVGLGCSGSQTLPTPTPPGTVSNELTDPIEIRSVNGLLDVTLEAVMEVLDVPTSATTSKKDTLRTYRVLEANGVSYEDSNAVGFPGP